MPLNTGPRVDNANRSPMRRVYNAVEKQNPIALSQRYPITNPKNASAMQQTHLSRPLAFTNRLICSRVSLSLYCSCAL